MMKVGSRKLKNRFGAYLKRVKRGEKILITDRGQPVARLEPVTPARNQVRSEKEFFKLLALTGSVRLGTGRFRPFKPVRAKGKPASRMIIEDRR